MNEQSIASNVIDLKFENDIYNKYVHNHDIDVHENTDNDDDDCSSEFSQEIQEFNKCSFFKKDSNELNQFNLIPSCSKSLFNMFISEYIHYEFKFYNIHADDSQKNSWRNDPTNGLDGLVSILKSLPKLYPAVYVRYLLNTFSLPWTTTIISIVYLKILNIFKGDIPNSAHTAHLMELLDLFDNNNVSDDTMINSISSHSNYFPFVNSFNFSYLWTCGLICASKMEEDKQIYCNNKQFSRFMNLSISIFNNLEVKFIQLFKYQLWISKDIFIQECNKILDFAQRVTVSQCIFDNSVELQEIKFLLLNTDTN